MRAQTGFNAEQGSSVSVPEGGSVEIASGSVFYFYTLQLFTPAIEPANGIEAQVICFQCTIRDTAAADGGPIRSIGDTSAVGDPYFVKTNARGVYQLIIQVDAPSNFGLTEYTAVVSVDIGVAGEQTEFAVSTPE